MVRKVATAAGVATAIIISAIAGIALNSTNTSGPPTVYGADSGWPYHTQLPQWCKSQPDT